MVLGAQNKGKSMNADDDVIRVGDLVEVVE